MRVSKLPTLDKQYTDAESATTGDGLSDSTARNTQVYTTCMRLRLILRHVLRYICDQWTNNASETKYMAVDAFIAHLVRIYVFNHAIYAKTIPRGNPEREEAAYVQSCLKRNMHICALFFELRGAPSNTPQEWRLTLQPGIKAAIARAPTVPRFEVLDDVITKKFIDNVDARPPMSATQRAVHRATKMPHVSYKRMRGRTIGMAPLLLGPDIPGAALDTQFTARELIDALGQKALIERISEDYELGSAYAEQMDMRRIDKLPLMHAKQAVKYLGAATRSIAWLFRSIISEAWLDYRPRRRDLATRLQAIEARAHYYLAVANHRLANNHTARATYLHAARLHKQQQAGKPDEVYYRMLFAAVTCSIDFPQHLHENRRLFTHIVTGAGTTHPHLLSSRNPIFTQAIDRILGASCP